MENKFAEEEVLAPVMAATQNTPDQDDLDEDTDDASFEEEDEFDDEDELDEEEQDEDEEA